MAITIKTRNRTKLVKAVLIENHCGLATFSDKWQGCNIYSYSARFASDSLASRALLPGSFGEKPPCCLDAENYAPHFDKKTSAQEISVACVCGRHRVVFWTEFNDLEDAFELVEQVFEIDGFESRLRQARIDAQRLKRPRQFYFAGLCVEVTPEQDVVTVYNGCKYSGLKQVADLVASLQKTEGRRK